MQRLLPVSPGNHRDGLDLEWLAEGLARAGCRQILLREPQLAELAMVHLATRLEYRLPGVILHDRMVGARHVARIAGWGLHLPGGADVAAVRDHHPHRLGVSCHSVAEVVAAEAAGADYALLSPIWRPTSKPNDRRPCVGTKALRRARLETRIPVFALGGLTAARVPKARRAGAFGVAVLGALFGDDPVVEEVEERARALMAFASAQLDLPQAGRRAR